ncbi:MAG: sigma 54-interacting transcriptional regulator [Candidatus Hydrogenedentes bacterium]|nr:sigma 54-interacting transcriptional regulator [Candidatus Hydrogenedentota bacterium]
MANVLIVEDEAVLRLTFAHFLEDEGHMVVTVETYDAAVHQVESRSFDIVITDIILPGKTGVELLRYLHEQDSRAEVIMITGEPNVETASEAVRLGAFDYLAKPVTGPALKNVVRLALDRQSIARERDAFASQMDRYRRELELIFQNVQEGIITVDSDFVVRQVNAAAAQCLGTTATEIAGSAASDVFYGALQPLANALQATLKSKSPQPEFQMEANLSNAGAKVLVASTAPLIDANASYTGALLVLRDITRLSLLENRLEQPHQYQKMVGKSIRMQEIFELIENVAETDSTVLICGESGTGKELVAAALHYSSPRADKPFIRVNCAALAEDILESELFGHVKGAFTGAVRDRVGRFEAANGGTILLDEIGDISPRMQLRLLRVLQEREFERVGDTKPIRVDVRVIASSNQNLLEVIHQGRFREDLYYRLNVVRIELPPLRERVDDIPILVDHLCKRYNMRFHREVIGLAPESLEIVMKYPWYGNIRELENCLERAFIVCHDKTILPHHLPPEVVGGRPQAALPASTQSFTPMPKNELTVEHIREVLDRTDWNIAKSARILGMARNTLYQRIKANGMLRG